MDRTLSTGLKSVAGNVTGTSYPRARERGHATWQPRERNKRMLEDCLAVINEYRQYLPLTTRQVGYRLLSLDRYAKTEQLFKDVSNVLNRGRRAGLVPWNAIRDDGIYTRGTHGYDKAEAIRSRIGGVLDGYRRHRQDGQTKHLEIWCEAVGMVPQVAAAVDAFGVPVYSSSGFDSVTLKRTKAVIITQRERPTVIGIIGDHDEHGYAVLDSRAEDVTAFTNELRAEGAGRGSVEWEWLAVKPEQIDEYQLATKPTNGKQRVGDSPVAALRSVQAEALDPPVVRGIVRRYVGRHLDVDAYRNLRADERADRPYVEALRSAINEVVLP